jgi:hypothetical protein
MALVARDAAGDPAAWTRKATARHDGGVVMHVASSTEHLPSVAAVVGALAERGAFHQVVLDAGAGAGARRTLAEVGLDTPLHRLHGVPHVPEDVEVALTTCACTVLVVYADDHPALCAALAAAREATAIVRIGGAPRCRRGAVVSRLADLLLMPSLVASRGLPPERIAVIGNPLVELVDRHAREALDRAAWRRYGVTPGD